VPQASAEKRVIRQDNDDSPMSLSITDTAAADRPALAASIAPGISVALATTAPLDKSATALDASTTPNSPPEIAVTLGRAVAPDPTYSSR
jgi:hypothetical protein